MSIVTQFDRDYSGDTRLLVVTVPCPIPDCRKRSSGVTHVSARAAIDDHFEYAHPGVPAVTCDAIEHRRKA